MGFLKSLFLVFLIGCATAAAAQRIVYSEPDREDTRRIDFDIVGKVSGNFLIYKNIRNHGYITVYNNNMEQVGKVEHDYIQGERLINVDFFPYSDFAYMVYQYQRRNVVYCEAVKINGEGKKASEVVQLDTTHLGFASNNKIYSTVTSEDRSKILVTKINTRNRSHFIVSTVLFDDSLNLLNRSRMGLPMQDRDDYLGEFAVDNEGDVVLTKFSRVTNDNIGKTWFLWKPMLADTFQVTDISRDKIFLDELHVKVDNENKRYLLTSFYYGQRRGNIEGIYNYIWEKATHAPSLDTALALPEALRKEARGESNSKMAFNDYFIRDILVKRDGGFVVGTEAYYTTSRYNSWNRWNYLYNYPFSGFDYYSYSPLYSNWLWRNRFNSGQNVRYHADNITLLSFDSTGRLEWSNVIHKDQFDDESDDRISYKLMNTGGQIHFLFNQEEKRTQLLNDFSVSPSGQLNRNPTLRNLDRGYEFLPKYARQVSSRQVIIPCFRNNYLCFAKLEYN